MRMSILAGPRIRAVLYCPGEPSVEPVLELLLSRVCCYLTGKGGFFPTRRAWEAGRGAAQPEMFVDEWSVAT